MLATEEVRKHDFSANALVIRIFRVLVNLGLLRASVDVVDLLVADSVLVLSDRQFDVVDQFRRRPLLAEQQLAQQHPMQILPRQHLVDAQNPQQVQLGLGRIQVVAGYLPVRSEVGYRPVKPPASSKQTRQRRTSYEADHYHYDHHGHDLRVVLAKPLDQIHTSAPIENLKPETQQVYTMPTPLQEK